MSPCSEPHPSRPDVLCDKSSPCFGYHANALVGESWPGNPLPVREELEKKGSRKGQLALIAQRATR